MKYKEGGVKKVDFRFEIYNEAERILRRDEKDEKIIKDGHRDVIFHYLYALETEIGVVKNPNFTFCIRKTFTYSVRKR